MVSARLRYDSGPKETDHFNLVELYYSKSEEKTQSKANYKEDKVTEKYNVHISELESKIIEDNAIFGDTFCFNSTSQKHEYIDEDELYEIGEGSENLEPSDADKSK